MGIKEGEFLMNYLRLCHFFMCFLLSASLIIGLTRKDLKQIGMWNWITRVCYGIMIPVGVIMWISALQAALMHSIAKCALAIASIVIIEIVYRQKKSGKLTKKGVIIIVAIIMLTILCGCTLYRTLKLL